MFLISRSLLILDLRCRFFIVVKNALFDRIISRALDILRIGTLDSRITFSRSQQHVLPADWAFFSKMINKSFISVFGFQGTTHQFLIRCNDLNMKIAARWFKSHLNHFLTHSAASASCCLNWLQIFNWLLVQSSTGRISSVLWSLHK